MILLALVAGGWWLSVKERPLAAGVVLALATFLKPQAVLLLPAALLVSGRYRTVAGWAVGSAVMAAATFVSLGPPGLIDWWRAIRLIQSMSTNTEYTLAHLVGSGPLTYALWGLQGVTALFIARWRRRELEVVFAVGLLGTAATASYFHPADYGTLVLAAWLVLRTSPPLWHRLWLLVGVVPMQVMTLGPVAPQLAWNAAWLGILAVSSYRGFGMVRKKGHMRLKSGTVMPSSTPSESPLGTVIQVRWTR
jgi:hypothetical protein